MCMGDSLPLTPLVVVTFVEIAMDDENASSLKFEEGVVE